MRNQAPGSNCNRHRKHQRLAWQTVRDLRVTSAELLVGNTTTGLPAALLHSLYPVSRKAAKLPVVSKRLYVPSRWIPLAAGWRMFADPPMCMKWQKVVRSGRG